MNIYEGTLVHNIAIHIFLYLNHRVVLSFSMIFLTLRAAKKIICIHNLYTAKYNLRSHTQIKTIYIRLSRDLHSHTQKRNVEMIKKHLYFKCYLFSIEITQCNTITQCIVNLR